MNLLARLRAGQLAGAQRLSLSCGLTEFPREIFELADTLEVLDLSSNALSTLPPDIGRLHRMRVLFCSNNRFTELPASLGQCGTLDTMGFKANRIASVPAASLPPSLRWLILTDNRIETLPPTLGQCAGMQKLMLAGNRLQALPDELAACRSLELLRIAANRFDALPAWLMTLPRLSWLGYGGNPMSEACEAHIAAEASIPNIDWHALSIEHKLGEGASGVIHQAQWRRDDGSTQPVAVKLFKGAVTSDGWPHSEMAACIAADAHPNLVAVLGRVAGHPDGSEGLVLHRIDKTFGNLAAPPSLVSCTRDVYADDAGWSVDVALRLARGIASAAGQLHARGILHGDLYGHNILWNGKGDGLLGDFGAASFLPQGDALQAQAQALQRIEVRAFGCLLEELLAGCRAAHADKTRIAALTELQARCMQADVAARPLLAEVAASLDAAGALPVATTQ
ncbi:MAG: leucine-rich repeat-containing protein kinase family protein [Variovorax sp.]